MALNKQLEKLKNNLKVPSLYYKQPEGPYSQPMNATPTFGLDPIVTPQNVATEQPVIDSRGNLMGGDPYPNGGNPSGQMAQPGTYGTPQAPNLDGQLNDLASLMRQQATLVPPVPTQPHHLNDSQAGIPLLIAALASLDPTVRRDGSAQNFLHNTLGGFVQQNQQEAQRQDQLNQQQYFVKKGTLDADTNIAKLKYDAAQGDVNAQRELEAKLKVIGAEGQQKIDLQNIKDANALKKFKEEIASLPEKDQASMNATYNFGIAHGMTPEQATANAMSQHYQQIAQGNLANTQAEQIKKESEARVAEIVARGHVNETQAKLYTKQYDSFDRTEAIKLGLLKLQIDSLGVRFQGEQFKNDPNKLEYDQLAKDHEQSDRNVRDYQRLTKEAADVLNDVVKNATLSPEEKARLIAQRDTNAAKAKAELEHLDSIDARMKALTKKITERVGSTLPPNPAASRGGRPASLPGNVPVDPTGPGYDRIRTAADALDQLGL